MAVAALSSSVIALATGPAAQPAPSVGAQGGEATKAFATLVTRAKSDGKAPQGEARPDTAETETETADATVDAASASTEGEAGEKSTDQSIDLLADIEAMVAAAGQLGVSAPPPAASAPAIPASAAAPETRRVIRTSDGPPAARARLPVAADTPLPATDPEQLALAAEPAASVDKSVLSTGETPPEGRNGKPAKAARSDIAAIIASLKTAFNGAPAAEAAPAAPPAIRIAMPGTETPPQGEAAPITAPDGREAETGNVKTTAGAATTIEADVIAATATPAPIKPKADKPVASKTTLDDGVKPAPPAAAAPSAAAAVAATDKGAPDKDRPDSQRTDNPRADAAVGLAAAPTAAGATPLAQAVTAPAAPSIAQTADAAVAAPNHADRSVDRHLDLARDNQWLDQLARDISQAATRQGHLKFQLNPEHLGALTVEIANSESGAAIRMTADTDQARAIIADAQPRLLAEVRAQGLRVAESHVDLNQQGNGGSASAQGQQQYQQQQQQSSADHKPFVRTQAAVRDDAGDSATRDDGELYA